MILNSKSCGANSVKFQVYNEENISHLKGKPVFDQLMAIRLDQHKIFELKKIADEIGIEFFATPCFPEAVDWLEAAGVQRYKIREKDNHNSELLARFLHIEKPIYISARAIDMPLKQVTWNWNWHIVYCVPLYPPPLKDIEMPDVFGNVHYFQGYSNHYPGIAPALLAVARGAEYIEIHVEDDNWHFDLARQEPIDHAVSWTFDKFDQFVKLAREMEAIL